ncbi:ATP-binding protein, partial [Streptomyces sp. SID10362]|nr:ATP-binding protein [Streptomyces sp. SID10362]
LVADRTGDTPGLGSGGAGVAGAVAGFGVVGAGPLGPTVGEEVPDARNEESVSPSAGVPAPFPPLQPPPQSPTLVTRREPDDEPSRTVAGGIKGFARRNLVAAGAGALLVAVLGTVVTLGATSENDAGDPSNEVGGTPSASQGIDDGSLGADRPTDDGKGRETPGAPTDSGPDGTPGTSDDPTPTESGEPSDGPSDSEQPGDPGSGDPSTPSDPTTSSKPPTSPSPTKSTPTDPPSSPSPSPDESETEPPESSPPETTPEPPSNSASDTNTPTAASSPVGTPTASQSSTGTATGTSPGSDDPETGQII